MSVKARGPISVYHMGQRYDIGDYVAVRGVDHPEYFGIVTGFEMRDNYKYFWMRWLVPKPGRLSVQRLKNAPLSMDDFLETHPEVVTCERVETIKYVFDSVPSYYITHPSQPLQPSAANKDEEPQPAAAPLPPSSMALSQNRSPVDGDSNPVAGVPQVVVSADFHHQQRKLLISNNSSLVSSVNPSAAPSGTCTPYEDFPMTSEVVVAGHEQSDAAVPESATNVLSLMPPYNMMKVDGNVA